MCGSETACSSRGPPALTYPPLGTSQVHTPIQDAGCALPPARSSNPSCGASIGPKGTTAGAGKMAFGQPVTCSGWRRNLRRIYRPGVTRLITRNPANSVNVARQMRAAAAAHPAGDKARVVVIAVAAPVAGVIDRIALLKRSSPDAEAAPACNWDNQAHLRRIKRYRPCRE
jgi:hypothetical protein